MRQPRLQEDRSFVPPVAKQLGVIGSDDQWPAPLHRRCQGGKLPRAAVEKLSSVRQRSLSRRFRLVKLLGIGGPGNPKILDPHGLALAAGLHVRPNGIPLCFPPQVSVEIAIKWIVGQTSDTAAPLLPLKFVSPTTHLPA